MQKLSELKAGTLVRICAIGGNAHFQSRIASVGLTPGCTVEIVQNRKKNRKKRPMLLYVRNTLLAVNQQDCSLIEAEVK